MSTIRPTLPPALPARIPAAEPVGPAQRAFFRTALAEARQPAPTTVEPAARSDATPARPLRPGSLLDITV